MITNSELNGQTAAFTKNSEAKSKHSEAKESSSY
jgi:hypothetical protein